MVFPGGSDRKESDCIPSLGPEDPMEKIMATHSCIVAWRIPSTEVGCSSWGHKESDKMDRLTLSLSWHNKTFTNS